MDDLKSIIGKVATGATLSREEAASAFDSMWRAISWTTAASAVSVVELVANGTLPHTGFIKQEDITLEQLFSTQAGRHFAEQGEV